MANDAIDDIHRRGRLAFLVGGSGLYVRAVISGFHIPRVAPNAEIRRQLQDKAGLEGNEALYEELKLVDPVAAERIDPRNIRRVIRALEVFQTTGVPFSQMQNNMPPFSTLMIGLTTSREDLYNRIDSRVDRMLERGLVHEVERLLEKGYSLGLPSMSGIGYRHIGQYLEGKTELEEAVLQMKYDTHRFARHQYAWFRPSDTAIHWFDIREAVTDDICELVSSFISGKSTERFKAPRSKLFT
jgi:tRNA dimethylallyltransferase